jgi:predicted acylesterase/phospholipase RssA
LKEPNTGKCHVLALSSGDEASVYQAGAIAGLVNASAAADVSYDAVSGVSGGALNAVILSSFAKGDESSAVDKLRSFWTDAGNTDLYKDWFGGVLRGLFFEGGIYNSKPLEDFIKKEFKDVNIQRSMDIGITNVADGSYVDFSDKNVTTGDNLVQALYASMSFAGFFPPADVLDGYYFDGSAVWDIDIFSAVNRCLEQGF